MKRRLCLAALCAFPASAGWALTDQQQQMADRYLGLVEKNPAQDTAFARLWALYDEAGETPVLLERVRAAAQARPEAALLQARILEKAGQPEEARTALQTALAARPDLLPLRLALANLLRRDQKPAEAAALLEGTSPPKDAELSFLLGEIWLEAGDKPRALTAWDNAARQAPHDLDMREKLAVATEQAGEMAAAEDHLLAITERGEPASRLKAWETLVRFREKRGDFSGAASAQESLIALLGKNHWQLREARQRLLALHQTAGSLEDLADRWQREADAEPIESSLLLRQADLHRFRGDDEARRQWLRRASDLLPKDAGLAKETAAADLRAGDLTAAALQANRALHLEPRNADTIFLCAEIDALAGRETEATQRIENFLTDAGSDETAAARAVDFYRSQHLIQPLKKHLTAQADALPKDEAAQTALAVVLLDHGQPEAAVNRLKQFLPSVPAGPEAAATALRFATLLKEAGLPAPALEMAQTASSAHPHEPETALLLAGLLSDAGEIEAARDVLRQAVEDGKLPREDLDRRLFATLQETEAPALIPAAHPGLQAELARLRTVAATRNQPSDWIRLARWLRWTEDAPGSLAALREGAERHPRSATFPELLAAQLAENGDPDGAIAALRQLEKLDPEKAAESQRRQGLIELDRQNLDGGLKIFEALSRQHPSDWKATADLALAEQMTGNWFEALETWQSAYTQAPPDARRGLRQPLLHAAARLQLSERALDFLAGACSSERDAAAQEDLLREAAVFAVQNQLTAAWQKRLQKEARTHPEQSAWALGEVFLLEAQGRQDDARQTLRTARPENQQTPADWEKQLRAAETAGDWSEAARLCAKLAESDPSPTFRIRRAEALEKSGQAQLATEAWNTLTRRFARSPETLAKAAEFFGRTGDETRREASLRAAAALGTPAPAVLLQLGHLALARGDRAQALKDFENVLHHTRPFAGGMNDLLPVPDRLLSEPPSPTRRPIIPLTGFFNPTPPLPLERPDSTNPGGARLLAIREIASLLANSPQKSAWLSGLARTQTPTMERIWAWHYLRENDLAGAEITRLLDAHPPDAAREQGFAALALESGQFDRLNNWAAADEALPPRRWSAVLASFRRMLTGGWTASAADLKRVFRQAPAPFRWQACHLLAAEGFSGEAAALGATVLPNLPLTEQITASLEVAQWELAQRNVEAAVALLDRALNDSPPATSFTAPFFAALRARWLLTPEAERPAFEAHLRTVLAAWKTPAAQSAAMALLDGLNQHPSAVRENVRSVLQHVGPADQDPSIVTIRQGVEQLENWRLGRLAREFYRGLLERDAALDLLQNGADFRRTLENQLLLSQLLAASSPRRTYLLNEWLARGVTDAELLFAASQAQQAGRPDLAAALFGAVRNLSQERDTLLPALLALARQPGLKPELLPLIRRLLEESVANPGRSLSAEGLWLAGEYEREGQPEAALALLEKLRQQDSFNRPLLLQQAHLLGKLGRHRDALRELDAGNVASPGPEISHLRADLLAGLGEDQKAAEIWEKESRSSSPSQVAALLKWRDLARQSGDPAALASVESLLLTRSPAQAFTAIVQEAQTPSDWQILHRRISAHALPPAERFSLGELLLVQDSLPPGLATSEWATLAKIARQDPALLPRLYLLRKAAATRAGTLAALETELASEWKEGWGEYYAGEILLQLALTQNQPDRLNALLDDYLVDRHYFPKAWKELGAALLEGGQPNAAERVLTALAARRTGSHDEALLLAQAHWKNGHRESAQAILDPLIRIAQLDPQRHFELARFYLAVGEWEAARLHREAAAQDPRLPDLRAPAAAASLQAGRVEEAAALLRDLPPELLPPALLRDLRQAQGQLETINPATGENFPPGPSRTEFHILMAEALMAKRPDLALAWLTPETLTDPRARQYLERLEKTDPSAVLEVWSHAAEESPFWDVRKEAASYFLRLAQAGGVESWPALDCLAQAHRLHPGSFAITSAYAEALLAAGRPDAARQALQENLAAFATPADHREAAKMLDRLQASPALPRAG